MSDERCMAARNKQFSGCEAKYARVVEAFSFGGGKGFGRRTLKVDGKDLRDDIPAGPVCSKTSQRAIDGLVASKSWRVLRPRPRRADQGVGRLDAKPWVEFAEEAYHFVK
ncbi:MAG: hypothetical protein JO334_17850 [Verrucomicrobia bacterium]|nr:hypothetical protein [Verrucomicrobiota bacterium]